MTKKPLSVAISTILVVLSIAVAAPARAATTVAFSDSFEGFSSGQVWADGSTHGGWKSIYNGYGTVGTETDGSRVLTQSPKPSTSPGETHAALVLSTARYGDLDLTTRMKTVRQLRTPTPNAWETAWLVWNYTTDQSFYYIVLKPNGWELGKVDGAKRDPSGPSCVWPSYANCVYPGAQRFLATGSSPQYPVGRWYEVNVRQEANRIAIAVNGAPLVSFTDTERPYTSGMIGLYNEDAHVHFDDVRVQALGDPPPLAPTLRTSPNKKVQQDRRFSVSWAAAGAESYDVIYRRASYASRTFTSSRTFRSTTPVTAATFAGYPGQTYCFRARARQADGAVSPYSSERCTSAPVNDRQMSRSTGWGRGSGSAYYAGTFVRATRAGATLKRSAVDTKQIWLVATKCRGCGVVDIYVGRTRVKRVSLDASSTLRRQMIYVKTLTRPTYGTVTLRVASSRKPVIIEGLGLVRR